MRKIRLTPNTRQWAMSIVDFARSEDESRYNLCGYQFETDRVIACDGRQLAWQTCTADNCHTGLVSEHGTPAEGEFPDYKAILPNEPTISIEVTLDTEWLGMLKQIAKLSKRPWGNLACDGKTLTVTFISKIPNLVVTLALPTDNDDLKPFKIGFDLMLLWKAFDAAQRSADTSCSIAQLKIIDHVSPIVISNAHGFYSITMPCRCDGAFTIEPEQTARLEQIAQAA